MLIRIDREPLEPNARHVFGALSIDGERAMLTMEPAPRADRVFIPGESGLPPGHYNLSISYCGRYGFRRELPLLVAMPMANDRRLLQPLLGMRIHHGLQVADTTSEIVVAKRRIGRTVLETTEAFILLMCAIEDAIKHEEAVEVEIR